MPIRRQKIQINGITLFDKREQKPINSHCAEKQIGISAVIMIASIKNNQRDKKNKPIFLYIPNV